MIGLLFVAIAVANALRPHSNMAWLSLVMSVIGISNSLILGFTTLRRLPNWQAGIRQAVLILTSFILSEVKSENDIKEKH